MWGVCVGVSVSVSVKESVHSSVSVGVNAHFLRALYLRGCERKRSWRGGEREGERGGERACVDRVVHPPHETP